MTLDEFLDQMRHSPRPVVVDVWAPWCMPCRHMAPALERVGREYGGRVDVLKLDADREPELARDLGIMGVPTLLVYRAGQELTRQVGAQPEGALWDLFAAAESGTVTAPPAGLVNRDRMLRLSAAAILAILGWAAGPSPLLLVVAALVFFSGVYDRCPIWRAVAPRLQALFRGQRAAPGPDLNG